MKSGIYWCEQCNHPLKTNKSRNCPTCGNDLRYLTTDARPVFARERRILQFYGHGPLTTDSVWRSSKSRFYYINGKSVSLPGVAQLEQDLPAIADYIRDSHHYDRLDEQLIHDYRQHPLGKINRDRSRPVLGEIYLEARPTQTDKYARRPI